MCKLLKGGDTNDDDDHLYMMFSATFNKEARKLARRFMSSDKLRITVGRAGSSHGNITQVVIWVDEDKKKQCLYDLLYSLPPARTIIFVNSKRQADMLDDYLYNLDMPSTSIHADRTQREREDSLRAFRAGTAPILVATGVTARGIDIKHVMHVINYDMPKAMHGGIQEYIHRIGRTARIGNKGRATTFYNESNEDVAEDLVKVLMETQQDIPDFLEPYKPQEGELLFDDDGSNTSEDDSNQENGGTPVWNEEQGAAVICETGHAWNMSDHNSGFDLESGGGFQAEDEFSFESKQNKVDNW
jgi:ATP-dependent RNA helicase DDX3X